MGGITARLQALVSGNVWKGLKMDADTLSLAIIESPHWLLHSGKVFYVDYSKLADTDGVAEVRVHVPQMAEEAHMVVSVNSALASTVKAWKATTKTHVEGNAIIPRNRHQESTNVSKLKICHTPAGSQAGDPTLLDPIYIGSASVSGKTDTGGNTGGRHEIILERGQEYLLQVTSRADNNALHINLDWYEFRPDELVGVTTTTTTTTSTTSTTTTI